LPPSTSRALALFQKLTGKAAAKVLKSLCTVNPKTFEGEILEFKSEEVQSDDFDSIWSKILSACANNEGGVLVWGIQAQRDPKTGIDAAHAVSLVPNVDVSNKSCSKNISF
jgi:predicted HTH transcriptional regulator